MLNGKKCLLIVDDTEIDRIILKSILSTEFEIMEAKDGNTAFEYITKRKEFIDAILLDISMPLIDGFDVLNFMKDKGIDDVPVFLVTAEPTMENVQRAAQFNIAEFIVKPFDKEDIFRRLRARLGVIPVYNHENCDMVETTAFIKNLEKVYKKYLANFNKNDSRHRTVSDLMTILLNNYRRNIKGNKLDNDSIQLISKAAYFRDIGEMLIPDRKAQVLLGHELPEGIEKTHVELGADILRLNRAKGCAYFVEVCSSMCMGHHERYDGGGYPKGVKGENNSVLNQLCAMVDEFEKMRSRFYGAQSKPVSFIIRRLADDEGLVSPVLQNLLRDSETMIQNYFMAKDD